MKSEVFKLKGLSKQVRNDYIRGAKERLKTRLVQEAEEKARKEDEEMAKIEAEERAILEAEKAVAAEAEAKAKANAKEVDCPAAEEAAKTSEVTLTRGESSTSDLAPLVLRTLEELKKE